MYKQRELHLICSPLLLNYVPYANAFASVADIPLSCAYYLSRNVSIERIIIRSIIIHLTYIDEAFLHCEFFDEC